MQVSPVAMVAYAYVFHDGFRERCTLLGRRLHGYTQRLYAVRGGYEAAVAVSLLNKMVETFHHTRLCAVQFLVPLYGSEVSRREDCQCHLRIGKMRKALPTMSACCTNRCPWPTFT